MAANRNARAIRVPRRSGRPVQPSRGAARPEIGRSSRSAARREAILVAALDEFSMRGFDATRIDDVAKRADVAKGTIYLYFETRRACSRS